MNIVAMPILNVLSISILLSFTKSLAADSLLQTQTLRDGETIVSADESFELGFFSLGKPHARYLGIQYKKVAAGTVIWIANRGRPLVDSSGALELDAKGILALRDRDNRVIWSSNTSTSATNPVIMQLLDSGNLVVRHVNDQDDPKFLWQSFDHPGDTFMQGMKIGNTTTATNRLSSWKSPDDPSEGEFTFELDNSGLQIVIKQNSVVKARSGPWNGISFSGMTYMKPNKIVRCMFVFNKQEKYYTTELLNYSVVSVVKFDNNGNMHRLAWIDRTQNWNLLLAYPVDHCDSYALCGSYGSCLISNTPVCGCLEGFVPKNKQEWDVADWSSGCMRRTELDCQKGTDGFKRYTNIKLPDMLNWSMNATMTLDECRTMCLSNCSCMAYSNSDIRGTGSGCFIWFGDLIDLKSFREDGQDLYIRMAASELGNHSERQKQFWIVAICTVSAGLLFIIFGLCLFLRKKKQKRNIRQRNVGKIIAEQRKSIDDQEDLELPHFDFLTIINATDNFSSQNFLGEGGFGPVYKGRIEGQEIAVKRLAKDSRQGIAEFMNEVKFIAKLQHRNLVKLLGYCIEGEEKMLIYEYMPNKSLNFYIFDQERNASLDWSQRFHIINGISRGLLYLHQDSRLRIIHRDLKLSNILLDNDMNPRISDFGMARSFGGNETSANTKTIVGTYGYMSPEYAIDGIFSTKSDIFSFGVLVLEIISGKKNRGFSFPDHHLNLLGHAWRLFKEGRSVELIDDYIVECSDLLEALRSIQVGLLCVQHCPGDRPSMSTVVLMLSGEGKLPQPKEPGFFTERKLIASDTSSSKKESCSVNEVTLTLIEAR